jgi:hypothetical protein
MFVDGVPTGTKQLNSTLFPLRMYIDRLNIVKSIIMTLLIYSRLLSASAQGSQV